MFVAEDVDVVRAWGVLYGVKCCGCWIWEMCIAGDVGVERVWGGGWNGKYPTEPMGVGGVGCGLRPSHKFSRFLKIFNLGITFSHLLVKLLVLLFLNKYDIIVQYNRRTK